MIESNPVFVKVEKYKEIMDIINVIDKKIGNVRQILSDLDELKSREDDEIASWQKNIEDVSHKLDSLKEELSGE
ncbi:MAG: hypothetical protein V1866_04585 [archaeon]